VYKPLHAASIKVVVVSDEEGGANHQVKGKGVERKRIVEDMSK
jgi:hypothetical protein